MNVAVAALILAMSTTPDLHRQSLPVIYQVRNAVQTYNMFCNAYGRGLFAACYLPEARCYVVAGDRGHRFLLYYDERAVYVLRTITAMIKKGC